MAPNIRTSAKRNNVPQASGRQTMISPRHATPNTTARLSKMEDLSLVMGGSDAWPRLLKISCATMYLHTMVELPVY
jgi:hypothetical protein